MAFERILPAVGPQPFTADGTNSGKVTIAKPWLFKVRQIVFIASGAVPQATYQVKRVEEAFLWVGPNDNNLQTRSNVTAYTAAGSATIQAPEQPRPFVVDDQPDTFENYEHEEEPTNAKRIIIVDSAGRPIASESTPDGMALKTTATISGDITIGEVDVSDRAGRILGHVEVDSGEIEVTNTVVVSDGGGSLTVDGSFSTSAAAARNEHGVVTALAAAGTATIATVVADASYKFRGFTVTGTRDAYFFVEYDTVKKYAKYSSIIEPNPELLLPNPDVPGDTVVVALKVTNRGTGNGDFEGVILGE